MFLQVHLKLLKVVFLIVWMHVTRNHNIFTNFCLKVLCWLVVRLKLVPAVCFYKYMLNTYICDFKCICIYACHTVCIFVTQQCCLYPDLARVMHYADTSKCSLTWCGCWMFIYLQHSAAAQVVSGFVRNTTTYYCFGVLYGML